VRQTCDSQRDKSGQQQDFAEPTAGGDAAAHCMHDGCGHPHSVGWPAFPFLSAHFFSSMDGCDPPYVPSIESHPAAIKTSIAL
jgi:hypothetical protein